MARPEKKPEPEKDPIAAQVLSLFLVILAFFIVLVSLSNTEQTEDNKTQTRYDKGCTESVTKSVNESFSTLFGFGEVSSQTKPENQDDSKITPQDMVFSPLEKVFRNTIKESSISRILDGNGLIISVPVKQFFDQDSVQIRHERLPLLEEVAQLINNTLTDGTVDLDILFLSNGYNDTPQEVEKIIRRSSALARRIEATAQQVMTPKERLRTALSVGMEPDPVRQNWIDFVFILRPHLESQVDFRGILTWRVPDKTEPVQELEP